MISEKFALRGYAPTDNVSELTRAQTTKAGDGFIRMVKAAASIQKTAC